VANHVLKPDQLQRFSVLVKLGRETSADWFSSANRRRGIKRHPRLGLRKVDFNPRVRITLTDRVRTCRVVVLAGQKTVHYPRGNTMSTQHDDHRGSKVFAMAGFYIEEEV